MISRSVTPQRWFAPAAELLRGGHDTGPLAFATAIWLAWLAKLADLGDRPDDPRADALIERVRSADGDHGALIRAVLSLSGLAPAELQHATEFTDAVARHLDRIRAEGPRAAMTQEAQQ